jgi:hypothetical protein
MNVAAGPIIRPGGPRVGDPYPIHFYAPLLSIVLACASQTVRPRPSIHPFFRSPYIRLSLFCRFLENANQTEFTNLTRLSVSKRLNR